MCLFVLNIRHIKHTIEVYLRSSTKFKLLDTDNDLDNNDGN